MKASWYVHFQSLSEINFKWSLMINLKHVRKSPVRRRHKQRFIQRKTTLPEVFTLQGKPTLRDSKAEGEARRALWDKGEKWGERLWACLKSMFSSPQRHYCQNIVSSPIIHVRTYFLKLLKFKFVPLNKIQLIQNISGSHFISLELLCNSL